MTEIKSEIFAPIMGAFVKLVDETAFRREVGFAVQICMAAPKLQECTQESLLKAVYNVALTGLTLNPMERLAYLTPRWNNAKKQNECLLMPSYIGLTKLAQEAGKLQKIEARIVYDGDEFDVEYQPNERIIHKPKFASKNMQCVYAIATLQNGQKMFEVMTQGEIFEIRALSDSWKAFESKKTTSAIWADHEGEMCRKTVIKRLVKYLPKYAEHTQLNEAIKLDNVDYMASDGQLLRIETLISTSTFDENKRQQIEYLLGSGSLTQEQAGNVITDLENNQQNALTQRGQVSPKAISAQLDLKDKE